MLSLLGDVGFVLDMPTHVSLVMLFASRVRVIYIYTYIHRHIPRIYIHTYTRTCVALEFEDVPTCAAYNAARGRYHCYAKHGWNCGRIEKANCAHAARTQYATSCRASYLNQVALLSPSFASCYHSYSINVSLVFSSVGLGERSTVSVLVEIRKHF